MFRIVSSKFFAGIKFAAGAQLFAKTLLPKFVKLTVLSVIRKNNFVVPNLECVRNTSLFNSLTQEQLWKGVTSVSNAGKRKGRGRGPDVKMKRDLNKGQKLGSGKIGIAWPGLNTAVFNRDEISEIRKLPGEEKKSSLPPEMPRKKRFKIHPLEKGWSGRSQKGKGLDPPDSINNENFDNFKSIILEHKSKSTMTSILGRKKSFFSIVATGNGNGVIGFGVAKRQESKSCLKLAKSKASKRLLTIDLIESHTVNHSFYSVYGRTKVLVFKSPEGYGLKCHRVIKAICQLIGIENLAAKVEGPCNVIHIIRAFITGLRRQKTYQKIADENNLHLVEFRKECFNFPRVLASPEKRLTPAEAKKNPVTFEEYIMGGNLLYKPDPKVPFYMKLPSWNTHLKRCLYSRNHNQVRIDLMVKYDACRSHLSEIYPECIGTSEYIKPANTASE